MKANKSVSERRRKMFRASLFALSLSVLGANASATTLIGSGAHTCGDYLSAIRSNPDREAGMTQWALGFISGTLLTLEEKKSFDVTVVKPAPMKSFLMGYCSQHASDDFYEAVDKYVFSLPLATSQIPPTLPDLDTINRQTDQDLAGQKGAEAKEHCLDKLRCRPHVPSTQTVRRISSSLVARRAD